MPRLTYPDVVDEMHTLQLVASGRSISRYGDGELKMASHDAGIKSQESNGQLSERMREILLNSGDCLVGIPNIKDVVARHVSDQKVEHWARFMRYGRLLNPKRTYVSSFITRPDSAPWINAKEYWSLLETLWKGHDVTLVRGSGKSLTAERLMEWGAGSVTEIMAPRQHAWAEYDDLMKRIGQPKRALLCVGPTATVMAVDLCKKGVHAIDCGHVGMFLKRYYAGEALDPDPEMAVA
jgi:hypothetical protein